MAVCAVCASVTLSRHSELEGTLALAEPNIHCRAESAQNQEATKGGNTSGTVDSVLTLCVGKKVEHYLFNF